VGNLAADKDRSGFRLPAARRVWSVSSNSYAAVCFASGRDAPILRTRGRSEPAGALARDGQSTRRAAGTQSLLRLAAAWVIVLNPMYSYNFKPGSVSPSFVDPSVLPARVAGTFCGRADRIAFWFAAPAASTS